MTMMILNCNDDGSGGDGGVDHKNDILISSYTRWIHFTIKNILTKIWESHKSEEKTPGITRNQSKLRTQILKHNTNIKVFGLLLVLMQWESKQQ